MDKKNLSSEEMGGVSGGLLREIDTKMPGDAVVRSGPGMQYPQIGSIVNHTKVHTTGNSSYNAMDGITWFEIRDPIYGWMDINQLGYY